MGLDAKKWLSVRLGVSVVESSVDEFKDVLVAYQYSLPGWKVLVEEDERVSAKGSAYVRVSLAPSKQAKISPKQLVAVQDELLSCAHDLCEKLGARGRTQTFHDPFSGIETLSASKEDLEGYWCLAFRARGVPYTNVLTYTFSSKQRVVFDEQFPALARKLFGATVEELVSGYSLYASWWQRLWRGREYVDALARSRMRLHEWFAINYDALRK